MIRLSTTIRTLPNVVLHKYGDDNIEGAVCLLNVVEYLEGKNKLRDIPDTMAPCLRYMLLGLNDRLNDEERQRLLSFAPRLVNTEPYNDEFVAVLREWVVENYLKVMLDRRGIDGTITTYNIEDFMYDLVADGLTDPELETDLRDALSDTYVGELIVASSVDNNVSTLDDAIKLLDILLKRVGHD